MSNATTEKRAGWFTGLIDGAARAFAFGANSGTESSRSEKAERKSEKVALYARTGRIRSLRSKNPRLQDGAMKEEFENARRWLEGIGTPDLVTAIPGNHDA